MTRLEKAVIAVFIERRNVLREQKAAGEALILRRNSETPSWGKYEAACQEKNEAELEFFEEYRQRAEDAVKISE